MEKKEYVITVDTFRENGQDWGSYCGSKTDVLEIWSDLETLSSDHDGDGGWVSVNTDHGCGERLQVGTLCKIYYRGK